jgi:hypothetical protein
MSRYLPFVACGLLVFAGSAYAQTPCPEGTLWEPYTEICAPVRDVRTDFLPLVRTSGAVHSDAPVPAGGMAAGVEYGSGELVAMESGRLHTRMFVYPDGLERSAPLPAWLYTTATSRVDNGLELLAMYSEDQGPGHLGLFAWTCLPDFPCPNGDTAIDWQWSRPLPELACNITQIVDQGGHAQKQLYYANHSDRLDNGSPPLWKSAVYLWDYCDAAWDLAWEHLYRQDKSDCSIPGATCAWWGPSVEIFGDAMYPEIGELGFEDSLLYHDGSWSRLLPPEAEFRDPADPALGTLTPWQVFHLEPNRSYGVGNRFNVNDAPVIEDQTPIETAQGEAVAIDTDVLIISDADVDPAYHVDFKLTVYGGNDFTYLDEELTPDPDFTGTLTVPVSVNDGAAESATFDLRIVVARDDGVPVITAQAALSTPADTALLITLADFAVADSDSSYPDDFTLTVHDGANYTRVGNVITPATGFSGLLTVPVTVSDGTADSPVFNATVSVLVENKVRPVIEGQQPIETLERTPVEITLADLSIIDPDSDTTDLSIRVLDGSDYHRTGNTVTPEPGIVGALDVGVVASDGELESDLFNLVISVIADTVPPEITVLGTASVTIQLGDYYSDVGATAIDNVDGDISDRIAVDNPVDTSSAGTYTVSYRVEDLAGNEASATRTVIVQAAVPPPPTNHSSGGGGGGFSLWLLILNLIVGANSRRRKTRTSASIMRDT